MARCASGASIRRRSRGGGDRDGEPRAARSARQHAEGQARKGAGVARRISAPQPTPWSPIGLRIELGADARNPGIHAEEDFIKGAIEVQDEGSQLAALLSAAKPGEQVIDLCAGAGGKTLALAAMMQGKGRSDRDRPRQAPARADPRAAVARRRAQRRCAHAEGRRATRSPTSGRRRSRADRCALHRHRHLAPQSRRQMADAPRRARGAAEGSGRGARSRRRAGQAGRPDRLHHLLGAAARKTATQVRAFVARHPEFSVVPPAQTASVLWDKAEDFAAAALQSAEGC